MSGTPRTDAVLASYFNPGPSRLCDLARELERELNAANAKIRQEQLLDAKIMALERAGEILASAADAADDDIGQHIQVANYNLHGILNTGERIEPPNPPHTIHQDGIDASASVRQRVQQAIKAWRKAKEAKP